MAPAAYISIQWQGECVQSTLSMPTQNWWVLSSERTTLKHWLLVSIYYCCFSCKYYGSNMCTYYGIFVNRVACMNCQIFGVIHQFIFRFLCSFVKFFRDFYWLLFTLFVLTSRVDSYCQWSSRWWQVLASSRLEAKFYGLGLDFGTYGLHLVGPGVGFRLGLEGSGLGRDVGLESCVDHFWRWHSNSNKLILPYNNKSIIINT